MFRNRAGWFGLVCSVVGVLTAVDVMPLVSVWLTDTFGAKIAHTIGGALTIIGTVIAKYSDPKNPQTPGAPLVG